MDSSTMRQAASRGHLAQSAGRAAVKRVVACGVAVCVREDDVRVLPAELEGHLLHGARRGRHDPPAGEQPAGERDEVRRRGAR